MLQESVDTHTELGGDCIIASPAGQHWFDCQSGRDTLNQLATFDSHSLARQNHAALMNRVDTKYLLPKSILPHLLASLSSEYTVLTDNYVRAFTYETTYFDTPERDFFNAHHNGKLNRHKLRTRHYVESEVAFLESKLRNNKSRTIKNRIPAENPSGNIHAVGLLAEHLFHQQGSAYDSLKPIIPHLKQTLFVHYRRITLLHKIYKERLTLDLDLRFQCIQSKRQHALSNAWIAEIKRESSQHQSSITKKLKDLGYQPTKFSKYCMGSLLTDNGSLKHNRFKPILMAVDKLENTPYLKGMQS